MFSIFIVVKLLVILVHFCLYTFYEFLFSISFDHILW